MTKRITVDFVLEKATAGALRYSEVDSAGVPIAQSGAVIRTLYIRKNSLIANGITNHPDKIKVTIEVPE